jgi:hypothetical protein
MSARLRSRDTGGTNIDIRGLEAAMAALAKLDAPSVKKVLQKASSAGAKPLKKAVQFETPKGKTGKLKKSISAGQARKDRPAAIVKFRPKIAYYRHMVMNGTKAHRIPFPSQVKPGHTRQIGARIGRIRHPGARANNIMGRAWDKGRGTTMRAVNDTIRGYLDTL